LDPRLGCAEREGLAAHGERHGGLGGGQAVARRACLVLDTGGPQELGQEPQLTGLAGVGRGCRALPDLGEGVPGGETGEPLADIRRAALLGEARPRPVLLAAQGLGEGVEIVSECCEIERHGATPGTCDVGRLGGRVAGRREGVMIWQALNSELFSGLLSAAGWGR
jgi:hypothetical protein